MSNQVVRAPGRADVDPVGYLRRRHRIERSLAVLTPVAFLILWEIASQNDWLDRRFFPPPTAIWDSFFELAGEGELYGDLLVSMRRVALGYTIGCGLGVVAGIAISMSRLLRAAFEPMLYALWAVPKLALLPLLFLIFGLGEQPIIVMIAINCFFLAFIPSMAALLSVSPAYREAARSFRANPWQTLRHVTLPAALPQIFVALRLAAGASILVLVAVEFLQSSEGVGYLIWNSWQLFQAARMYVGIVIVAIVGALFSMLVAMVGRLLCPWWHEE